MRVTAEILSQQLQLADELLVGRGRMLEPQDLPGRYGRVVKAIDRVLNACGCESVVGGGWAVWRHGYVGRVTQDIDIALPKDQIAGFLQAASLAGFDVLEQPQENWPKLHHRETGIDVDILPEGGRPGSAQHPAPTTIPHPGAMGGTPGALRFMALPSLIELKLAAGRVRDDADIVELARENPDQLDAIREHLAAIHADYANRFVALIERT